MNEDFVSFSLAKKLKEKNFIGNVEIGLQCGFYYKDGEDIDVFYDGYDNADVAADEYLRPTISQVLKWLREEKKIYLELIIAADAEYMCDIYKIDARVKCLGSTEYSKTYEAAAIAGIEYVIDNLI